MKSILFAFALLFLSTGIAREKKYYTIIHSYFDTSIAEDSVFVTGKVLYETMPALDNFGKVASLDFKVANIVGRSGNYNLKMSKSAQGFYFFQEGYREVVVNLNDGTNANYYEINIVGEQYFRLIQAEKPVVYLYSPVPIQTELVLAPRGDLSFTYPKYEDNWQVETQKDGGILNLKTGKTHPYLFWEANQNATFLDAPNNTISGFLIQTDSAVQFLEYHLSNLGLNDRESTDFITYWAPRLMTKPYATVQFVINDNYNAVFGGITSTTPLDYKLRIGMLFEVTNQKPLVEIVEPNYKNIEKRHGFSLVEWGGIELKNTLVTL